jgi:hypothetical protein
LGGYSDEPQTLSKEDGKRGFGVRYSGVSGFEDGELRLRADGEWVVPDDHAPPGNSTPPVVDKAAKRKESTMSSYEVFKSGPRKGQPKTLTDRVVRYLVEGRGWIERGQRGKYRWFTRPIGRNYFVGKAGAVRAGVAVSDSVSLTDVVHERMRQWEIKSQNYH